MRRGADSVRSLRLILDALGTAKAHDYRPHDLRRGHAEDLRLGGWCCYASRGLCMYRQPVITGAPLWKILAAGEWRSPSFMEYVDQHRLEMELVLQGCLDEESDDDPDI